MRDFKSPGILYALLANRGQFDIEANESAARTGVSATRALMCELLAIKVLKDFTSQELTDVLSFDFWPLQGDPNLRHDQRAPLRMHRISALEIAIRNESKNFLQSPSVVQVLENIWAGNIVFYSAVDQSGVAISHSHIRKSATLYDAREASFFKLSRLRVPRYRNLMHTFSFTILLVLYLSVLSNKNNVINTEEVLMCMWAFAYMLDEVQGIANSGSSLFLLNLWNMFDIGMLVLFAAFLFIRLYVFIWEDEFSRMNKVAFDLLGANAIFLFPRLFAALDHIRYFSYMIISFRRMAIDLMASITIIFVFFTGFYVAFCLAFARGIFSPQTVAYNFMQILMGFTLPAWQTMDSYSALGKIALMSYVGVSHFLVMTILVSVLSNTFSEVSGNARKEHQYLFAINTISAVISDAYFYYQPPFNLFEWILHPTCYVLSMRSFIILNRTVIKITHFPFLLCIYLFEKFWLQPRLPPIESNLKRMHSYDTMANAPPASPTTVQAVLRSLRFKTRRDSGATQQRNVLLEQVFKRPPDPMNEESTFATTPLDTRLAGLIDRRQSDVSRTGLNALVDGVSIPTGLSAGSIRQNRSAARTKLGFDGSMFRKRPDLSGGLYVVDGTYDADDSGLKRRLSRLEVRQPYTTTRVPSAAASSLSEEDNSNTQSTTSTIRPRSRSFSQVDNRPPKAKTSGNFRMPSYAFSDENMFNAVPGDFPSSLATQMADYSAMHQNSQRSRAAKDVSNVGSTGHADEDVSRQILSRISNLEEGARHISSIEHDLSLLLKEVRRIGGLQKSKSIKRPLIPTTKSLSVSTEN